MRSRILNLALLLGTVSAPFLPLPWPALVLAALTVLWVWTRPPRREVVVVVLALAVSATALVAGWLEERQARSSSRDWVEEARREYAELWDGLRDEAQRAVAAVGRPPETREQRLAAFSRLAALQPTRGRERRALLLLDPDGNAIAWAGEGLLHEPRPGSLPRAGLHSAVGWSAVTFLAVAPLDEARRPWRIVAGASYPTHVLPFPGLDRPQRWSVVDDPAQALPGAILVRARGAPTLIIDPALGGATGAEPVERPWARRVAWAAIAFALLSQAATRALGLLLAPGLFPPGKIPERRFWIAANVLGGAFAGGMAAALPLFALAALEAGLLIAALGLTGRHFAGTLDRPWRARWIPVWGVVTVLLLAAVAWGLQRLQGPLDLSSRILVPPVAHALRLAWTAAAFGLLCFRGLTLPAPARPRDRWAWLAVLLLLAGGLLADHPWAALPLLAAGGGVTAFYARHRRLGQGIGLGVLALFSVLVAMGSWEVAYRLRLRAESGPGLLDRLAPPSEQAVSELQKDLRAHFQSYDLRDLVPRSDAGLERQDLAFALWRDSPLARPHALSAVVVEPLEGDSSSFSFGIPIAKGGIDTNSPSWQDLGLPRWEEILIPGQAELRFAGRSWGTVRYWLMPRPGFQAGGQEVDDVETGLLKGGPAASRVEDITSPALFAIYWADGRVALSPWEEAPPLDPRLRREPRAAVRTGPVVTPSGLVDSYRRATRQGWEVIYLPRLTPLQSLERIANSGIGTLFLLAAVLPLLLLPTLPRSAFRDGIQRVMRSYSKRLLVVYTALLLLPLLLLSAFLVQAMEQRLQEEQRAAGEAAMWSAQKMLGEYILTLPPGFILEDALDDDLLSWVSEVIHHEVNLYWGSGVYASTKHELFTAGLLPRRIPGEIYSHLVLGGFALSSRTNVAGDTTYLELYAPVRIENEAPGEERLFLSLPLLAQQEEAARDLAQMRRQGVLVATGLFLLLAAVGMRLARNFTRPLMQLIEGTRRIAAGAPSLDLAPSDLELASLVAAVDEMARRIAEGRERLMREKQVVERMVDNITSGVVSVDRDRRVLMRNRVAAELLGVEVGESLEAAVARGERLGGVSAFLKTVDSEMARETVRLPGDAGGEREWSLVWVPVPGSGEPSALLVVEDATEVLRGQRLLAWAEMARMIAHEIKNPLTPIRLSAEHMREVYRNDPSHFDRVFERCTSNILTQVEELRSISAEFSAYSAIPRIDPRPGDLTAAVAELVEGYQAAPPDGVTVELDIDGSIPARFDAKLLGRAVRNLMENALRAAGGTSAGRSGEVVVRVERSDGIARIAVLDSGPGVRPENLQRIFDPYFSTHDTGTGLGLPIARRIVEEHGGGIIARNRPEGGLEVTITLPVA